MNKMESFILGIDDAGRGPVIGPMVLAGVLINKETESYFRKLDIRDSKIVLPKKRQMLAEEIRKKAKTFEVIISVDEIDSKDLNLNQKEAVAAAQIVNKLNNKKDLIKVVVDCPSTNINAWKEYLEQFLIGGSNLSVVCEHKADANHVSVAAASILAKVTRDAEIEKLKKKLNVDFGSGYPSDPKTRSFVYEHYDEIKGKGVFRESWGTIKKHKSYKTQKKLF